MSQSPNSLLRDFSQAVGGNNNSLGNPKQLPAQS